MNGCDGDLRCGAVSFFARFRRSLLRMLASAASARAFWPSRCRRAGARVSRARIAEAGGLLLACSSARIEASLHLCRRQSNELSSECAVNLHYALLCTVF